MDPIGSLAAGMVGVVLALPGPGGAPEARATAALYRLGYTELAAAHCVDAGGRRWACLVVNRTNGHSGWVTFRATRDRFVLPERRSATLPVG